MTYQVDFSYIETDLIKGLEAEEQVATIRSLARRYLNAGPRLRELIESDSGAAISLRIDASNEELMRIAFLALVKDDIGTNPDSRRRADLLSRHEVVRELLRINAADEDLLFRKQGSIRTLLSGNK